MGKACKNAVVLRDGRSWRLFAGNAEIAKSTEASATLPEAIVEAARTAKCRSVRFLLSVELHRMEGVRLNALSFEKMQATCLESIAETTGRETDGLLVAAKTYSWSGVRKPLSLASAFDGAMAEEFEAILSEAGISCGGFGSLEAALVELWTRKGQAKESLVYLSYAHSLVIPASRGMNAGPQTAACGERHFTTDEGNWLARFQRSVAAIDKTKRIRIISPGGNGAAACAVLANAGFADVVEENAEEWLGEAALVATEAKANRTKTPGIPLVNPFEPQKKFSNGWIWLAVFAILALPVAFRSGATLAGNAHIAAANKNAAMYHGLEERVKKAKKALAMAREELEREEGGNAARVESRRPLKAFMDVAYFFCSKVGRTVMLDSIEEHGTTVEVQGTFTDPEDGVALNNSLLAYAKEQGMDIIKNQSVREVSVDAAAVNRFMIVLDCAKSGGDVK